MRRATALVLGVVTVLLVTLAVGLLLWEGGVLLPSTPSPLGGDDAGPGADQSSDRATEETSPATGTGADGDGRTYSLTVDSVDSCGSTCRDVTTTLTNHAADTRTNVTVVTRLYAADDLLWTGTRQVGTLASGATHTTSERVDLSYDDALAVQVNDGYVTIETTISADSGTSTFTERRRVG